MVPDRVEREILIEAPPDIVWTVITEAEHVGRWFSDSAAIDLRPGGELILTWDEHGAVYWRVEKDRSPALRLLPLAAPPRGSPRRCRAF